MRERRVLTPEMSSVPLLSLVSAHVNEGHQILGTHWSASSFEEVRPAAWWTEMPGTRPARARGEGGVGLRNTEVPGTCSGLAFPGHSFPACSVPIPCHTGQAHGWVVEISGP